MAERSPGEAGRYSGGPYAVLFNPQGSKPLAQARVMGNAKVVYESQCKSQIVVLQKHVSGSRLIVPMTTNAFPLPKTTSSPTVAAPSPFHAALITHPVVVCQVLVPVSGELNVDMAITDSIGRYRLVFSSSFSSVQAEQQHCKLPLHNIPRGMWLELAFHVPSIYAHVNPRKGTVYRGLEGVAVGPVCWIRRIYTLRDFIGGGAPGHSKASAHSVSASLSPDTSLATAVLPPMIFLPSTFAFPAGIEREVVVFVTGAEGQPVAPPPPPPPTALPQQLNAGPAAKLRAAGPAPTRQPVLARHDPISADVREERDVDDEDLGTGVSPVLAAANAALRNRGDVRRVANSAPRIRTTTGSSQPTLRRPVASVDDRRQGASSVPEDTEQLLARALQATQKPPTTAPLGGSRRHATATLSLHDTVNLQRSNQLTVLSPGGQRRPVQQGDLQSVEPLPRGGTETSIAEEEDLAMASPLNNSQRHMATVSMGGSWKPNASNLTANGSRRRMPIEMPWQRTDAEQPYPDFQHHHDEISTVQDGEDDSFGSHHSPKQATARSATHRTVSSSANSSMQASKRSIAATSTLDEDEDQRPRTDISDHPEYDDEEDAHYNQLSQHDNVEDDDEDEEDVMDIDPRYDPRFAAQYTAAEYNGGSDEEDEEFNVVVMNNSQQRLRGSASARHGAVVQESRELDADGVFVYHSASPNSPSRIRGTAVVAVDAASSPIVDLTRSSVKQSRRPIRDDDSSYEVITVSAATDPRPRPDKEHGTSPTETPSSSNTKYLLSSRLGLPHRHGDMQPVRAGPYGHGAGQLDPYDLDSVRLDTLQSLRISASARHESRNDNANGVEDHGTEQWIAHRVAAWNSAHPSNVGRYGHLDTLQDTVTLDESAYSHRTVGELDTPTRAAIKAASDLPPPPPPPPPPQPEQQQHHRHSTALLSTPAKMVTPLSAEIPDAPPFQYHEPRYNPHRAMHHHAAAGPRTQQGSNPVEAATLYPPVTSSPARNSRAEAQGFFTDHHPPLSSRYAGAHDSDDDVVETHAFGAEDDDDDTVDIDDTTDESPYKEPPLDASQANWPLPVKELIYTDEPTRGHPSHYAASRPSTTQQRGSVGQRASSSRYRYDPTLDAYYDIVTNTYVDSLP